MKKIYLTLLFLFLILDVVVAQEQGVRVAVMDFSARGVQETDAATVSEFLQTELVKTGILNVLDRKEISQVLTEQKFQLSGVTTKKGMVEIGRLLNVGKLITGSLTRFAGRYYITTNVIDAERGEILFSERLECSSEGEIIDQTKRMAEILVLKMTGKKPEKMEPVETSDRTAVPYIVKVSSDNMTVTINRGFYENVARGDIYKIYKDRGSIGRIVIMHTNPYKAVGRVSGLTRGSKVKSGLPVIYHTRLKTGGIGVMLGFAVGKGGGGGGSLYYNYVSFSGFGLQLNLGIWGISSYDYSCTSEVYAHDYYGNVVYSREVIDESEYASYSFPAIVRYHYRRDSSISPYVGGGLCLARYSRYKNAWKSHSDYYDEDYHLVQSEYFDSPSESEEEAHFVPVFNCGVDFFSTSFIHLTLDIKYFLGLGSDNFKMNTYAFSCGGSLNW
jgi:TolB-like protein